MDVDNYEIPDDEILTFVMMHWIQGATPGLRYYQAAFDEKEDSGVKKAFGMYHSTPVGVSYFPKEIATPPRDWVAQIANIQFWRQHTTGGHFPHVECPEKLVQDLREYFSMEVVRSALAT